MSILSLPAYKILFHLFPFFCISYSVLLHFFFVHISTWTVCWQSMDPKDVSLEDALNLLSSKDTRQSGRPKRKQGLKEAE